MTLARRLSLSYLLLLCFLGTIALVAILRLDSVTRANQEVIDGEAVRADLANRINLHAESAAGRLALLFVLDDRDLRVRTYHEIDEHNAGIERALTSLKPLLSDNEGTVTLARLYSLRSAYDKEFTATVEEIEGGERAAAARRMAGTTRQSLNALLAATSELAHTQQTRMTERQIDSTEIANNAKWVVVALSVAALLAGFIMATRITRTITEALARGVSVANAVAQGNLSIPVQIKGQDELAALGRALDSMREGLIRVVTRVREGAQSVSLASAEIAQGNHDLSNRTEDQASALQVTASSMEDLSSIVKQNAGNAQQASDLALSASDTAVKGGDVVAQVVATMRDINDSSRTISEIVSVIDGIAFQTNILALNAAVEAARAGEQGRGFAVVAAEVRALAKRSAQAAREIKGIIESSVQKVEQGTSLVDAAGRTMTEVVSSIRRVTEIVTDITAASHEQSLRVGQVSEAINHMDQTTQQNAALVEQMAAAAAGLKVQAGDLVELVAGFNLLQAQVSLPGGEMKELVAGRRTEENA